MAEEEHLEKKFARVSTLKPGSYVLIDDCVCQVKALEKSKGGKHGAAKARITAFDVFTGQKRGMLKPTTADTEVPIVKRGTGQVVAVVGDAVKLMDVMSYEMFDAQRPKDISGLSSGIEVEYLKYGKSVKILRKKGGG